MPRPMRNLVVKVFPLFRPREELQIEVHHIPERQDTIHERQRDLVKPRLILFIEILDQREVGLSFKGQRG